jgi:hypothetical protein
MDVKMTAGKIHMQPDFKIIQPEQNDASLESISQTVQKLQHFQMLVFRNSRWRPAAKMAEFVDIAW